MKKVFIIIIAVILALLCSCSPAQDNKTPPSDDANRLISTDSIQYNGWRGFVSDADYVIASQYLGFDGVAKINISTGNITDVCLQPGCGHSRVIFENLGEHCYIPEGSSLLFVVDHTVYYKYTVTAFDEKQLEAEGTVKPSHTQIFACYDLTTGKHREIISIKNTEFETMYNFVYHNGYIYYTRYIANIPNPSKKGDFSYSLCRMKVKEYEQQVLFAFSNEFPANVVHDPLAIDGGRIYFTANETGQLYSCNLDGTDLRFLLDGDKDNRGIFDSYGTFFCNGYIYYASYVSETDPSVTESDALYLNRVSCSTGEVKRLTEDYIKWLFVSDEHIYYELSSVQPGKAAQDDTGVHKIKQMTHDCVMQAEWEVLAENVRLAQVWGAGDCLYFKANYRKDTGTSSMLDIYTIRLNISDGKLTEIGRTK